MAAQFERDTPEDQQPKHDHERQIKAAERRRIGAWKERKEHAARGDQPDFVSIPKRADARDSGTALLLGRENRCTTAPTPRSYPSSSAYVTSIAASRASATMLMPPSPGRRAEGVRAYA